MMAMTLRQLRRFGAFIPRLEAEASLRRATENSLHRIGDSDRRKILGRWQQEASGGQRPLRRALTVEELKARSRVGG